MGVKLRPHSFWRLAAVRGMGKRKVTASENKWVNVQIQCVCWSFQSNWTWSCVGEGRAFICNTIPKSRKRGVWEREPACFFGFKLLLSYATFSLVIFILGLFHFTCPNLCFWIPAASQNSVFLFLPVLLPTSKMLERELGWPLCWWHMKEKQTQLACLQLQWFSRAGNSKDMLFVDKTHNVNLWEGAEIDGISVWSSAVPHAPSEIPACCAGLTWGSWNGARFVLVKIRMGTPRGAVSTWQVTESKSRRATCSGDVHAHLVFVNLACMCVHVFR